MARKKFKFVTDTPESLKGQLMAIMDDERLDDTQRKHAINHLRRSVMAQYSYYSPQMRAVDDFIRRENRRREKASRSATEAV